MLTGTALAMFFSQSVLAVRLGWPPYRMLVVGSAAGLIGTSLAVAVDPWLMVGAMVLVGASVGLLLPGNLAAMSLSTGVKAQGKVAGINARGNGRRPPHRPHRGNRDLHASPLLPYWLACSDPSSSPRSSSSPCAEGDRAGDGIPAE